MITKDIRDFHRKFGLEYKGPARPLPEELAEFRRKFMIEEMTEYDVATRALMIAIENNFPDDVVAALMAKQLDALVDLTYVVLGTAHLHGFNFDEAWRRVHRANMRKRRARKDTDSKRGSAKFDVVKPKGWTAPVLTDLVE